MLLDDQRFDLRFCIEEALDLMVSRVLANLLVDLVIAVRSHTAVLALAAGRVPYHLHYANKGRGLCQRLDLPGCDLASLDPQATLNAILATGGRRFSHGVIREQVLADFRWCLDQLPVDPRT